MAYDRLPNVLTVEEAAKVLRIGRTAAYQLAQRFEATAGAEGLPVIRVGHLLRVPVPELERRLGGALRAASPSPIVVIQPSDEAPAIPGAEGHDDGTNALAEPADRAATESARVDGQSRQHLPQERRHGRNRPRSRDQLNLFVSAGLPAVDSSTRDSSSSATLA